MSVLVDAAAARPSIVEADRLLADALDLAAAGAAAAAEAGLRRLLDGFPDDVGARLALAEVLAGAGRPDEAARESRLALAAGLLARPSVPRRVDAAAMADLARALADAGDDRQAVRAADAALAADPGCVAAALVRATLYERAGERKAAVALLQSLGEAPEAVLMTARLQDSVSMARRAAELMPDDAAPLLLAGRLLARREQPQAAAEAFRAALALAPDHLEALDGLVEALRALRRFAEALPLARRQAVLNPDSAAAHLQLARLLAASGAPADAVAALQRVFALETRMSGAARLLGSQLRALGRDREAADAYALAAAESPEDGKLLLLLAAQWQAAGQPGEAAAWYRRAADRDVPQAKQRLERAESMLPALAATPEQPALAQAIHRFPQLTAARALSWVRLEGGEHNETFRVTADGTDYVLRFGKFGEARWDRFAEEFHNAAAAARLGLAPRIYRMDAGDGAMLSEFVHGRTLESDDLGAPEAAARCGSLYRRLHAGPRFIGTYEPLRAIGRNERRLGAEDGAFPDYAEMRARMTPVLAALERNRVAPVPGHFDPVPANLIDTGTRLVLIDWQCSGMGDPHWELGALATHASMDAAAEEALVAAYFGEAAHPGRLRVSLFRAACCYFWFVRALVRGRTGAPDDDWRVPAARWLRRLRRRLDAPDFADTLARAERLCCR